MLCYFVLCYIVHVVLCSIVLRYNIMLCYVMLYCYDILYSYVMCNVMIRYVILCYDML